MSRLYVRSHTPGIVLVGTLSEDRDIFLDTLLHLSAFPLQAFLYETQRKEPYGAELKQNLTTLIEHAQKTKKEFWCTELDGENWSTEEMNQRISALPTLKSVWKDFQKSLDK